jgi:multiple antibiotic resistance protein
LVSTLVNGALFGESFVTLFVIMDPPGAIPMFLVLTRDLPDRARNRAALQSCLAAFGVIVAFAVFGQQILNYLGISLPALQCAGGLLLLLVALQLLTGEDKPPHAEEHVNVALVPLGTPLLAGPGAIVATMVLANRAHNARAVISVGIAVLLVHVALWLILRYSTLILRVLRDSGITLVTRIAGMLLSAIAVQLIADAVRAFIKGSG